jgi:hypothetical protein
VRLLFLVVLLGTVEAASLLPLLDSAQAQERRPRRVLVVGDPGANPVLPPEQPWSGLSRKLAVGPEHEWATPWEGNDRLATPRYEDTGRWLERLSRKAPEIDMVSLGRSPEGRDLWLVSASAGGAATPEELRKNGSPVVWVQACVHGGEPDGKDAGLLLLRDLTVVGGLRPLLDEVSLLFVPIVNVDGHERFSRYGRINRRGPEETGRQTNSRRLDLDRDWAKLDAQETRILALALKEWQPDLLIDIHLNDVIDHQYDITWGYNGPHAHSPNASAWLDTYLTPAAEGDLIALGHVPGPLVAVVDPEDWAAGLQELTRGPHTAVGLGDVLHLPSVRVETHAMKPYEQRVLGTRVLLESALRVVGQHGKELRGARKADLKARPREITLLWGCPEQPTHGRMFLGTKANLRPSPVTGGLWVEWTGEPTAHEVPVFVFDEPEIRVSRPQAYWIPPAWDDVIERLSLHGIEMERIDEPREKEVTVYRLRGARALDVPSEGRMPVRADPVPEPRVGQFPPGSVRVPTDQPQGDLVVLLLEPGSPHSLFQWGFFLGLLEREGEVAEYIMEPTAIRMFSDDRRLREEFTERLLAEPEFAADAEARLEWFFRNTPFFDPGWRVYPVAREE